MSTTPEKILIIDDDPDIHVMWKNFLKALNFGPPISVLSGEALKKAAIDYDGIRVAIVDFKFEGSSVDGANIVEYLRGKNIRKIFLSTGYAGDDDVCRKARAMGIDGIIPKPVTIERIREILS